MIRWLADQLRRGRYRSLVAALPHLLQRRYGGSAFYKAPQVKAAAALLKIRGNRLTVAYAVACELDEFLKAVPAGSAADYESLRGQLARLFYTDEARLNCRDLTRRFDNPVDPIEDSVDRNIGLLR